MKRRPAIAIAGKVRAEYGALPSFLQDCRQNSMVLDESRPSRFAVAYGEP